MASGVPSGRFPVMVKYRPASYISTSVRLLRLPLPGIAPR
jgi:hypothetical protein